MELDVDLKSFNVTLATQEQRCLEKNVLTKLEEKYLI